MSAAGNPIMHERLAFIAWATVLIATLAPAQPGWCWDSRTHQLITRLAIAALPPGALRTGLAHNAALLEEYAIEPDTVLRPLYGKQEGRRHYIDLEYFGTDPFAHLDPDFNVMAQRVGVRTLDESGTLPWAIESEAAAMGAALQSGDCATMLRHAGYLAHYVGDASQPLHTTRYFDGYAPEDRGMHARLEGAADHRISELEDAASGQVHWHPINSVWAPVIDELEQSHALVPTVVSADRTVSAQVGRRHAAYTRALMAVEQPLIVRQLESGASVLASIWIYEAQKAGNPAVCESALPAS